MLVPHLLHPRTPLCPTTNTSGHKILLNRIQRAYTALPALSLRGHVIFDFVSPDFNKQSEIGSAGLANTEEKPNQCKIVVVTCFPSLSAAKFPTSGRSIEMTKGVGGQTARLPHGVAENRTQNSDT